jgi:integrase
LTVEDFVEVYRWLEKPDSTVTRAYCKALQIIMLTGCRVQEIARLTPEQWDPVDKVLTWGTTKNGTPHALPVCDLAAELLDSLTAVNGWLVPSAIDPTQPATHGSLYCVLWRIRDRMTVDTFTNRDLRRTWKTLAGQAGLTKADRDVLQNHAGRQDVSSRHYDRYDYMDEKRSAVKKWGDWIAARLG